MHVYLYKCTYGGDVQSSSEKKHCFTIFFTAYSLEIFISPLLVFHTQSKSPALLSNATVSVNMSS